MRQSTLSPRIHIFTDSVSAIRVDPIHFARWTRRLTTAIREGNRNSTKGILANVRYVIGIETSNFRRQVKKSEENELCSSNRTNKRPISFPFCPCPCPSATFLQCEVQLVSPHACPSINNSITPSPPSFAYPQPSPSVLSVRSFRTWTSYPDASRRCLSWSSE